MEESGSNTIWRDRWECNMDRQADGNAIWVEWECNMDGTENKETRPTNNKTNITALHNV